VRKVLLLLVSTGLALGTLELAIRLFDLFAPARAAIAEAAGQGARPEQAPASNNQLHPFWGWSVRPNAPEKGPFPPGMHRNRFGFMSAIDDYRTVSPDDFTIGIFGGSVASGLASWGGDEIVDAVARAHPELAGRVRVLNFGSGSYKQPQQLMVLSEMILLGVPLDYVVNVDGLNEAALGAIDVLGGHHPIFPARPQMEAFAQLMRGAPTDAFFEASAEIIHERKDAERIEAWVTGPFADSELARALAGALAGRHRRRATELEAALQTQLAQGADSGLLVSLPDACLEGRQGCSPLIANLWTRSSLLMAVQAASIGASYLHALQPSQYVGGSKTFTRQETRRAYAPDSIWMESVRSTYPLFRARAQLLAARGVDFLDLTPAFSGVTETLYTDICCHVNETGYGILGERIGERIAQRLGPSGPASH
jgi:hypothetical protein